MSLTQTYNEGVLITTELVAGELADIELPVAPPTEWLINLALLGQLGIVVLLTGLLFWLLSRSRQFKQSLVGAALKCNWRAYQIKKRLSHQACTEQQLYENAALLYPLIGRLRLLLQKYLAIEESVEVVAIKEQAEEFYEQLQGLLFSDQVSRETLLIDTEQLQQNLTALCKTQPYWVLIQRQFKQYLNSMFNGLSANKNSYTKMSPSVSNNQSSNKNRREDV